MAVIIAPNPNATAVAGVQFVDGRGECTNRRLIAWFAAKGYTVVDDAPAEVPASPVVDVLERAPQERTIDIAERPAQSAPKAAWVDYAIACGMSPDVARVTSKADLIAMHPAGGES